MLWDSLMPDPLNWEVGLQDIYRRNGTVIPGKKEIYRIDTDQHFGVVGDDYTPMQNHECVEFLKTLDGATVVKAGVFGGGAKTWWALQLPGVLRIDGEELHKYSIMVNAHDGSLGFRWFITPIRPSCSNMMNLMIKHAIDFNISARHTRNISSRVNEAARIFTQVNTVYNEMEFAFHQLATNVFNPAMLGQYVEAVLQPTKVDHGRFKTAMAQIEANFVIEGQTTRWTALNAVTQYLDHQRPMRGEGQEERRFANAIFGSGAKLKQRALEMIQEGPDGPNFLSYVGNRIEGLVVAGSGE